MKLAPKSLILINTNILTIDPVCPQATWVAIENDKFVETGFGDDWKNLRNKSSGIIDCRGKTVLPGFIDAHLHLVSYAKSFVIPNVNPSQNVFSIADIQSIIHNCSLNRPPGKWIFGRGYNEFYLAEKRHPDRWDLDKAAPENPVKLTHRSGHTHILNSAALKLVGITKETGDPDGGMIERDLKTGEPTGQLYEMGDFLSRRISALAPAEIEQGLQLANHELISLGITSIQDASFHNDKDRWELFMSWKASGKLQPRVDMMLGYQAFKDKSDLNFPIYKNETQLTLRSE